MTLLYVWKIKTKRRLVKLWYKYSRTQNYRKQSSMKIGFLAIDYFWQLQILAIFNFWRQTMENFWRQNKKNSRLIIFFCKFYTCKGIVVQLGLYHSKSSVGVGMLDYKNPLRIIQKTFAFRISLLVKQTFKKP